MAEGDTFSQTLETLKDQGSNILIVGSDATAGHEAVCRRLLADGENESESRYRVGVLASDSSYRTRSCLREYDDAESEQEQIRVLTHDYSQQRVEPTQEETVRIEQDDPLGTLSSNIIETIQELEDDCGGFEPAELRVCVDVLVPLLREHNAETVFRLLHLTTTSVKNAGGMGHYHLPVDRNHDTVNLLETLFDAVVEVRENGETIEQRWSLRDQQTEIGWIEL